MSTEQHQRDIKAAKAYYAAGNKKMSNDILDKVIAELSAQLSGSTTSTCVEPCQGGSLHNHWITNKGGRCPYCQGTELSSDSPDSVEETTAMQDLLNSLVSQINDCGQGTERYILSGVRDYVQMLLEKEQRQVRRNIPSTNGAQCVTHQPFIEAGEYAKYDGKVQMPAMEHLVKEEEEKENDNIAVCSKIVSKIGEYVNRLDKRNLGLPMMDEVAVMQMEAIVQQILENPDGEFKMPDYY